MAKILLYFCFAMLVMSCQKEKTVAKQPDKKRDACELALQNLVKNSGLDLSAYDHFETRIEDEKNETIKIQVFIESTVGGKTEIAESTIAWLLLIPANNVLLDITADPDNPKLLKSNPFYIANFLKNCHLGFTVKKETGTYCKTSQDTSKVTEICLFKNTTVSQVYDQTIAKQEVNAYSSYLPELPKYNIASLSFNSKITQGLLFLKYYPIENTHGVRIVAYFEDGENDVRIVQTGRDVERTIVTLSD